MLFFCFSVKDRLPLINSFNQYIGNFGIDTWYDRRNIFIGDKRYEENIKNGAKNPNVKYAVVFYSSNFVNGNICLDEYDILVDRYKNQEISIFPVFLGKAPEQIDKRFGLCKELVFKEIFSCNDFFALSLHIVAKIVNDMLKSRNCQNIKDYLNKCTEKNIALDLLKEYENISKNNLAMRVSFLFCIFKSITYGKTIQYFFYKTMNFLYYKNCINPIIDEKRELQIMESIVLIESLRLFPVF